MSKVLAPELLKKIAYIKVYTKRLLNSTMAGDSRSAQRGSGFEFDQIREYQMGDDVRHIAWHASARTNTLLVKEYVEERNRTIIVALDVSYSTYFSSGEVSKLHIMQQVAAILTIVAVYGKDRVGLLLYAADLELFIPPNCGNVHMHCLLQQIFTYVAKNKTTNFNAVQKQLRALKQKNALLVLISDFLDVSIDDWIRAITPAYEIIAIRCLDSIEQKIPNLGFVTLHDLETNQTCMLDARGRSGALISQKLEQRAAEQLLIFKKHGIKCLDLVNDETFVGEVIRFFRRRMAY